jgi:o-succinylbenzoate synthase
MRIDRLELFLCRLPLVHFFETSFGRSYDRTFILARMEGDGHEGWGEAVAEAHPYYSGETTETVSPSSSRPWSWGASSPTRVTCSRP